MTDYYPPLARAITGLEPNAPGESRRALYERARAALIAKLRGAQPPLLETEITREQSFLEDAIGKVESEAAGHSQGESDPLAELARLIGQTDPFGTMGRAYVEPEPEPEQDYEPSPVHPLHRYTAQHQLDPPPHEDAAYSQPAASEVMEDQEGLEEAPSRDGEARQPKPKLSLPPIFMLPEQNEKQAIAFRPSRRGPLELLPDVGTDFLDPEQSQLYVRMRTQLTKLREEIPSQERIPIDEAISDFLDQPTRACRHLSQASAQTRCNPARKLRAVFS